MYNLLNIFLVISTIILITLVLFFFVHSWRVIIGFVIIGVGIILLIHLLNGGTILYDIGDSKNIKLDVSKSLNTSNKILEPSISIGDYGGLISGVVGSLFSLAGIFFLWETIDKQQKSFELERFESKYFELIRYHRENVAQLPTLDKATGIEIFYKLFENFKTLYSFIYPKVKNHKKNLDQNELQKKSINISYYILYFGISHSKSSILTYFPSDKQFIVDLFKEMEKNKVGSNDGNQARLAHYFRHLYQTVKFVNSNKRLSYEEKKEYVKILRAQLSQFEIIMFFFNSLFFLGKDWIVTKDDNGLSLIEGYELIKHLPPHIQELGIKPNLIFPNISFELQKNENENFL